MSGSKPGRNEPCWCGSGKKYKKCHLEADRGSAKGTVPPAAGVGSALVDTASGLQGGLGLAKRTRRDPLQLGEAEREAMRRACAFNAQLLDHVRPHVQPGVSTEKLDKIVHEYTLDHGHTPACLGYLGYPKTICTSINEVVCHGIPSPTEVLKEGDIVNVDLTTVVDGWFGDQSETFMIGEVPERTRELVQVTFDCLWAGLRAIRPSGSVNDIGRAIEKLAHSHAFSVVREYQGHGIGRRFHQDPSVLHYPHPRHEHIQLKPGYCFTVEPMINEGTWKTALDRKDGWTVRTTDGLLSAQFEHTVLVTDDPDHPLEVLTLTKDGPAEGHRF